MQRLHDRQSGASWRRNHDFDALVFQIHEPPSTVLRLTLALTLLALIAAMAAFWWMPEPYTLLIAEFRPFLERLGLDGGMPDPQSWHLRDAGPSVAD